MSSRPHRSRLRPFALIALVLAAALIAAGCGQYGKRYTGDNTSTDDPAERSGGPAGSEQRVSNEPFDAAAREADGCTEVEEFESEGASHLTDPEEKVDYQQNPPASGDHYQIAAPWGLYDETQSDVETVHNLEHGHILITYTGLKDADRDKLYEQARINPYHLLVMPRDNNPKPGVYYTVWTAQMYCERPSAPALQHMIDEWRDQGPELFTDDEGGMGLEEKQ